MPVLESSMTDSTAGRVPIIACVRSAWMFLIENWRMFVPAAAIVAIVSQVGPLLALLTAPADPAPQSIMQSMLGDILTFLPAMAASLLYSAAILRKAVRDEVTGRFGLTFGADEVRLLGVAGAMACLFIPLISLVVIVLSITVFSKIATSQAALEALLADPEAMNDAIVAALGEGGAAALSLFIMIVFVIFMILAARLYMVNAATIGERRIVMFQTWSWSSRNVLTISPPPSPPSGPRSMIQSAVLMTSRLCSITTTVLPLSTSSCSTSSSFARPRNAGRWSARRGCTACGRWRASTAPWTA
jgi:hypothetical protein